MRGWFTPGRRRGVEILDDPATPGHVRHGAMADIRRSNALLGGATSAVRAVRPLLARLPRHLVIVDVGTGMGDIAERVAVEARRSGRTAVVIGLDREELLARVARRQADGAVVGDALALPLRDGAADLVLCSQVLHHFFEEDARRLVAELHRVARGAVLIADLRRSWIAAAGFWLVSIALQFHPVTRRDGMTSVLRGFTAGELEQLVRDATGVAPAMRRGPFWRLTATWHLPRR